MAPAEGKPHLALLGQHLVAAIAVDLQDALEAAQMCDRPLGLAVGRIDVGNARRIGAAPRPVVPGIGEELTGLGPSAPRIEHRRRRLVGEQLGRGFQLVEQPFVHRPQQEGRASYPVGQGRAIQGNALAGIDLGLSIQRKMIGELRDQHLSDGRLGGQPAFDQSCRSRRLHDHVRASAAGVFGPAHDQHPELGRHDVQALRDVLADAMQCPRAARADGARHIDHPLDPRQVRRQRAAVGPTPGGACLALGWILLLRRRLA